MLTLILTFKNCIISCMYDFSLFGEFDGSNYLFHKKITKISEDVLVISLFMVSAREALTTGGKSFYWYDKVFSVELVIPIDSEDVDISPRIMVEYKDRHLAVGLKGQPLVIDARLYNDVKESGITWNLRDGSVRLTMKKSEEYELWPKLFVPN